MKQLYKNPRIQNQENTIIKLFIPWLSMEMNVTASRVVTDRHTDTQTHGYTITQIYTQTHTQTHTHITQAHTDASTIIIPPAHVTVPRVSYSDDGMACILCIRTC